MEFNLAEKLAIVKSIDRVISADGELDEEEILYLHHLMRVLDFDMSFVHEARKFNIVQANAILNSMTEPKKKMVSQIMQEMAKADGHIHDEEMKVIISIFLEAGIDLVNTKKKDQNKFDLSDIYFESSDYIEYVNGLQKSGPFGHAKRAIKIETTSGGEEAYIVTSYNLDDDTPLWGNNVQMPSKQMKIVESAPTKTVLRGFGEDPQAMGDPDGIYSNYGVSIMHPNNEIEKIVIHYFNREVDIEYMK